MLKIFNQLRFFFEDVYREISVREFAGLQHISPPSASKFLKEMESENILKSTRKGVYIYYRANRNYIFRGLSRLYWQQALTPITEDLHKKFAYRNVILFGSIAKTENTIESDVDLYIDAKSAEFDMRPIEKRIARKIELHFRTANKHLKKNIDKGLTLW